LLYGQRVVRVRFAVST